MADPDGYAPRPASNDEIAKELERSLADLCSQAPRLFKDLTTQAEALERMNEFLEMLQYAVYQPAGMRAALTVREMRAFSIFFPATLAIIKTMQNNPLWGTRALREQLEHNYTTIIKGGQPLAGLVFEKQPTKE